MAEEVWGMNLPWYQTSLSCDNVFYFSFIVIRIIYGECTWSRTRDLRIKNPLLYLLSYTFVVVSPEFESGTARLSSVCSTAELWNVNWKALIDSNYRIMESKSIVLTNFTKCPLKDCKKLLILYLLLMVLRRRIELLTWCLQGNCSTNWANVAFYLFLLLSHLGSNQGPQN